MRPTRAVWHAGQQLIFARAACVEVAGELFQNVRMIKFFLPSIRFPRQVYQRRDFWSLSSVMLHNEQVARMRIDYENEKFDESSLVDKEPIRQFDSWFREATNTHNIGEANAMTLGTCSADGRPSSRIVLLKGYDHRGFRFYTNYDSRKGTDLSKNPYASLVFYWHQLHRQVRVEGRVERLPAEEAENYFHTRPRNSQIGACISNQSSVIPSRQILERKMEELNEIYADENTKIPKPTHWGGFLVVPEMVEFWQGQSSRVHDRIAFRKLKPDETIDPSLTKVGKGGWVYERLSP